MFLKFESLGVKVVLAGSTLFGDIQWQGNKFRFWIYGLGLRVQVLGFGFEVIKVKFGFSF